MTMTFPILLTENSLGKRQQELNVKVKHAADQNVPLEEVIMRTEETDVDRLFKIDLASKYRNSEYIVDTLKCGDSLYISRALKCVWLYDDENIINPTYLHCNVFPYMSTKMQRKLLTVTAIHVRNEKRNELFYQYCITSNMPKLAKKFFLFSSTEFIKNMLENDFDTLNRLLKVTEIVQYIIGHNYILAEYYIDKVRGSPEVLYLLRYFYFMNPDVYLNWVEKYEHRLPSGPFGFESLGSRLSKDIMRKQKNRVINNVSLYLKLLKRNIFLKHTTVEEAKQYLTDFLPERVDFFWGPSEIWDELEPIGSNPFKKFDFLLYLIPEEERYHFMKESFDKKYPGSEFEMTDGFQRCEYHLLMTVEEREAWALRHVKANLETSVRDQDYSWYQYISFDVSVEAVKKYVLVTPDAHERARVVHFLIKSARRISDVENLLNYYYQRFINETLSIKEKFVCNLIRHHNVFEFNASCWEIFRKLLCSLEIYNPATNIRFCETNNLYFYKEFQGVAAVYHIVNNIKIPCALKERLDEAGIDFGYEYFQDRLNDEKRILLYKFMFNVFMSYINLKNLENTDITNNDEAFRLINYLKRFRVLQKYLEIADEELPDIVLKLIDIEAAYNKYVEESQEFDICINQNQLMRILKEDAAQVIEKCPAVEYTLKHSDFKFNTFLKKLRVYFMNDIAQFYLKLFITCLTTLDEKGSLIPVYGIFQIADTKYKTEFVKKYVPTNSKIDHSQIDRNDLSIQEGICRFAGYSRPPIPLPLIRKYIVGDYVQHCLPMFDMYIANLRPTERLKFVESLIYSAVSLQKHAIRYAFKCFGITDLINLLNKVWQKSKNITLRMVIYSFLYKEIAQRQDATLKELFACLLNFMSDLHEDDHADTLRLLTGSEISRPRKTRQMQGIRRRTRRGYTMQRSSCVPCYIMPDEFIANYIERSWKVVSSFPNKPRNAKLKEEVLGRILKNMDKIDKTVIRAIVDEYFDVVFNQNGAADLKEHKCQIGGDYRDVFVAKELVVFHFMKKTDDESISTNVELLSNVMQNCLKKWNETLKRINPDRRYYFIRDYCFAFFRRLSDLYDPGLGNQAKTNLFFECVLAEFQSVLPIYEIYIDIWRWRLIIMTNTLMDNAYNLEGKQISEAAVFEHVVSDFAQQICALILEMLSNQKFYVTFLDKMSVELMQQMGRLRSLINYSLINHYDINVITAVKLVDCGRLETTLLAVKIVPDVGLSSADKWHCLLRKLQACDNLEVKCQMMHRFKVGGFLELM